MLARRVEEIPAGDGWIYEPKWDGFRALVFRSGKQLLIQSRDQKSLNRYFPELLHPLLVELPTHCVLDGEIVIARPVAHHRALDFDALQLRIHPAASRVARLARETPASIVFFDLLALGQRDLRPQPFHRRRAELEKVLRSASPPLHLTPAAADRAQALDWFRRFEGAGLDGVVAKPKDLPYQPDKRVMFKIKHERDCDCVVAGFRWYRPSGRGHSARPAVGSLLLGLYDGRGTLHHVGVCGSFPMEKRCQLVDLLAPYRKGAGDGHPWIRDAADPEGDGSQRIPGGQSRWSRGKDLEWEPLRPELVAEVAYEHMQSGRFRHMAQFRRWRTDKPPQACTYDQLEVTPPQELREIFSKEKLRRAG